MEEILDQIAFEQVIDKGLKVLLILRLPQNPLKKEPTKTLGHFGHLSLKLNLLRKRVAIENGQL